MGPTRQHANAPIRPLKNPFQKTRTLLKKVYFLARPYGLKKLALVFSLLLGQGVFQVVGVTSIFPFLALAADPERIRNSQFGRAFLAVLPPMDNRDLLVVAGVFAILMLVLANAMNLMAEYVRVRYAHSFGHWLRIRLIRQIASQPYGYFLETNSSLLVKKVVGDVMQYTTGVLLPLLDAFARSITALLLIATLFLVHPGIAAIATLVFALFYITVFKTLGRIRRETSAGLKQAMRGTHKEVTQLFAGIKPIKVHRAEEHFLQEFWTFSEQQSRLSGRIPLYQNGPRYLVEPLAFGGLVAIVIFLAVQGRPFADVLPNLGVMALAGYRLLPAVQLLYGQLTQISTMHHALDEVYDEFRQVEQRWADRQDRAVLTGFRQTAQPLPFEKAITLENLSFAYEPGGRKILDNINLTIPKNSSVAFVGETGSGKSTLVDLILGLHQPTGGQIRVDDTPLSPDTIPAWQQTIGYVPQDIFLIDDTLARNIALGIPDTAISQPRLQDVCQIAQILNFIEKDLPQGFHTVVGERGVRLSGGQRQRIGLARALYHDPEILILDEATSALDSNTEARFVKAIEFLQGQITLLTIAHRLGTVRSYDQTIELFQRAAKPINESTDTKV